MERGKQLARHGWDAQGTDTVVLVHGSPGIIGGLEGPRGVSGTRSTACVVDGKGRDRRSRLGACLEPARPVRPAAGALPALWGSTAIPLQGAIASSSFDVQDQPRRAAEYMDRILKGAAPGELPFQQPTKFDLVIHAKTAREFDVSIPRSLLLRADRIEEQ